MKKLVLQRKHGQSDPDDDELQLVSTQMLKQILSSRNRGEAHAVELAAKTASEGVLVRHRGGEYEIIDDDEFEDLIAGRDGLPQLSRPTDVTVRPLCDYAESGRFSLVSSRALRRALDDDDEPAPAR